LHFNDQFRNGSSAEIDQLNADVRAALRTW
jgi:hypothetical protein